MTNSVETIADAAATKQQEQTFLSSLSSEPNNDNSYYYDHHTIHRWIYEDRPTSSDDIINENGMNHIALHQYVPGTYTPLDVLLNPFWTYCTELLPLHIAPNVITLAGGISCGIAYMITWMYGTTNFMEHDPVPNWIFLLNGLSMILYYTLDCMDGKQARRTNTSSPLGQLFDHGIDCCCLQQHLSCTMCFVLPNATNTVLWFLLIQASLQISFFVAQWEEYHTGSLPHSTGFIGVTEVNYGVALWSISNLFYDHSKFYNMVVFESTTTAYQMKHIITILWISFIVVLIILSVTRVIRYISRHRQKQITMVVQLSALSKFISPIVICIIGPVYILPHHHPSIITNIRYISMSIGLAMTMVTIKIIVYSMAKLPFATIQIYEIVYIVLPCLWIRYDPHITNDGIRLLWQVIAFILFIRLLIWIKKACQQICSKLQIQLLRIPYHKNKET